MELAFLYNIRHNYPDPQNPSTFLEADYDDKETIRSMTRHLQILGFNVHPIEADERAYFKLFKLRKKLDLVFNYSLGVNGKDGYCHIPAICEMLKIPYTGSSPKVQATIMYKASTKDILRAYNIPTLPYQLFSSPNEELKPYLKFPLIVKPVARGSSAGITNKSVVKSKKELQRQIIMIIKVFKEEALVEPFLEGREFSLGLIGNPPRVLPIIESDHSVLPRGFVPIDSLEVKWHFEEKGKKNNLVCPANINSFLIKKLENIAIKTWEALGVRDYCRIDIRCDSKEHPFVLEVNSPPGLIPPDVSKSSYLPLAARVAGIDYDTLLKEIITTALKRYNKI